MKPKLELAGIFVPPYPLTYFEIQKYYQNEPKLNGAFSINYLPKIKHRSHIKNLDQYKSVEIRWRAFYVNGNNTRASYDAIYFNSFGVEHIPKDIKKSIASKTIITNIYRIQAYDSIICGYFCIGFIEFLLKDKSLLDYTNLFSPNGYEKNYKEILKYFQ